MVPGKVKPNLSDPQQATFNLNELNVKVKVNLTPGVMKTAVKQSDPINNRRMICQWQHYFKVLKLE